MAEAKPAPQSVEPPAALKQVSLREPYDFLGSSLGTKTTLRAADKKTTAIGPQTTLALEMSRALGSVLVTFQEKGTVRTYGIPMSNVRGYELVD